MQFISWGCCVYECHCHLQQKLQHCQRREEVQASKFYFREQCYTDILQQVSANFFGQGPSNKYLRLFRPVVWALWILCNLSL